jgi:hypothetical protein
MYTDPTMEVKLVNILTTLDPSDAEIDDEYGFNEEITEYFTGNQPP